MFPLLRSKLMRHENRWRWMVQWWQGLGRYWQHFVVAVLLGIGIELLIHAAHDFSSVKRVQNKVLDTSLRLYSQFDKEDRAEHRLPVFLALDDMAMQSPAWGNGKPLSLAQALQLIAHAYDRGARHVFLDITFDADLTEQSPRDQEALASFMGRFAALSPDGPLHLYVARSPRVDPCFPRTESLESLAPSVWDTVAALDSNNRPGLVVHSVLPHYRTDQDHVVRGWDLFGVLGVSAAQAVQSNPPVWRFLPSPQLAHLAVKGTSADSLHKLPWLSATPDTSSSPGRAVFAASQVQRLPLLSGGEFGARLCTHHPHTLGCPVGPVQAHSPAAVKDPQRALERVNDMLRPLPAEHECRSRAMTLLGADQGALDKQQPHDLLFNRIVYSRPSWEQAAELNHRGYYLRTPLTLQDDSLDWRQRVVVIGAAHAASGDWHLTPLGRVPGALINLNAIVSLDQSGPISSPPTWMSLLINGLIIVLVAAVFSALRPFVAALLCALIVIGSLVLFHQYLLSHGIWIEFGAPLIGINLHRILGTYLARRRTKGTR